MNILIIDDEDIVRRTLERYIEYRGDTPLLAAGGRTGLKMLEEEEVDLVITDVRMPDIDGMQVLHSIRDHHPDIPVIIVTAYADTDMAIQAVNEGAFAFLQKPVLPDTLDASIGEALATLTQRRQQHARLKDLERAAQEQRKRLELERAFSAAVLHNIPFPVCLIDSQHRLHMTNAAFRSDFADGEELSELQELGTLLRDFDLSPLSLEQIFSLANEDGNQPGITVEITLGADRTEKHYYHVTAFFIHHTETELQRDLTCLFLQDQTLQVHQEREQQLRDWCLKKTYQFRAETAPLVDSPDLLPAMTKQLADCLTHFGEIDVTLSTAGQHYTSNTSSTNTASYMTLLLQVENEVHGQLELFSPHPPKNLVIQREFVENLADTAARRLESRALQLQLLQNSHLHALGEMAAGVAHELNQPLSGIRTFAEGLLFGMHHGWETKPEEVRTTLEDIVEQVDRMTSIIGHMRDFSRDSSGEDATVFAVEDVLDNVFKLAETQLRGHGIAVEKNVQGPLPPCRGWPQQLEQVLLNLINNARQAMDEREEKKRRGEESDAAWSPILALNVSTTSQGDLLVVEVADTGGGIPEDIIKHIFNPFFTSKQASQGTGLGLSISHSIVQKHGGEITVENRPGMGATFSVRLPIDTPDAHQRGH